MRDNKEFSEKLKRRIYGFVLDLVTFTDGLSRQDNLCRIATDQLLRCGTSIGANYIEAVAGSSRKDFTNFLSHSLKSSNETKFWLALLRDTKRSRKEESEKHLTEVTELSNILASSIRTLRGK